MKMIIINEKRNNNEANEMKKEMKKMKKIFIGKK